MAIEYALVAALVGLVLAGGAAALGDTLVAMYESIGDTVVGILGGADGCTPPGGGIPPWADPSGCPPT